LTVVSNPLHSWFLGPKGENEQILKELLDSASTLAVEAPRAAAAAAAVAKGAKGAKELEGIEGIDGIEACVRRHRCMRIPYHQQL